MIKDGKNPYFVKELQTGYVVIGDFQLYNGYSLFLSKDHATELHQLDSAVKKTFLNEMSLVAEAVFHAFNPVKLNYELLGNSDAHMHWHIFPRYADDPKLSSPVWVADYSKRRSESTRVEGEQLETLRSRLRSELDKLT